MNIFPSTQGSILNLATTPLLWALYSKLLWFWIIFVCTKCSRGLLWLMYLLKPKKRPNQLTKVMKQKICLEPHPLERCTYNKKKQPYVSFKHHKKPWLTNLYRRRWASLGDGVVFIKKVGGVVSLNHPHPRYNPFHDPLSEERWRVGKKAT